MAEFLSLSKKDHVSRPTAAPRVTPDEIVGSIEEELSRFLRSKADEMDRMDPAGGVLLANVRRLIEAGGSRIRPLLCVTAHRGCGGNVSREILRVAASFELLHTFALIHDDLIDGGRLRRGAPTVVAQDAPATAVLAGDLAFALSDELYFGSGFDPPALLRAFSHLAEARSKALTGQYLELISAPAADPQLPAKIAILKTSSYSLVAPLTIGAELARASGATLGALQEFGHLLGLAYQIRDDSLLLDPHSEKDVAADIRNGRPNSFITEFLSLAETPLKRSLMEIWGSESVSDGDVDRLRQMAADAGVPASMSTKIRSLVLEAKDALKRCPPGEVLPNDLAVLNSFAESISN